MINEGVQGFIRTVGEEGCYALTLCKIAEIYNRDKYGHDAGDAVCVIGEGVECGLLKPDMTVLDGAAFLQLLTEKKWTKEYKDAGYKPVEGDYLIAEWFNKRTGKTHFTLEYPAQWNSLADSVTVKEGAIRSYRLYRVKK
ncbi:MAG: hypothetical protein LBB73_02825 [Dysgonamonadaceae bacterium]|jgi:hypothetical protein|nr:hypothetical protein [Dysgonamonadaceae bacterium]